MNERVEVPSVLVPSYPGDCVRKFHLKWPPPCILSYPTADRGRWFPPTHSRIAGFCSICACLHYDYSQASATIQVEAWSAACHKKSRSRRRESLTQTPRSGRIAGGGRDARHPAPLQEERKGCDDLRGQRLSGATACVLVAAFALSSSVAARTTHKIRRGDTLWSLAAKNHTTPRAIARANGISEKQVLALGKTLVIPGSSRAARTAARVRTAAAMPKTAPSSVIHTRVPDVVMRSGPSTNRPKIAVLPMGTTAKLLSRRGSWAKVAMSNGACGFIYRPLLAPGAGTNAVAAAPQAASSGSTESATSDLIRTALACRGIRYSRGGTSRGGFDCSGFTRYVFAKYGIALPHSSAAQARLGTPVSRSEIRAGDLVFFQTYRRGISHVGIYIGDNRFVHAATHGRGVTVDSLGSAYYAPRYRGARRVK